MAALDSIFVPGHRLPQGCLPLRVLSCLQIFHGGCLRNHRHDRHQALSEFAELVGDPPRSRCGHEKWGNALTSEVSLNAPHP
jgi:hypothetical protein